MPTYTKAFSLNQTIWTAVDQKQPICYNTTMMNISTQPNTIRTIRHGDKDWLIDKGLMVAPRAGFEIGNACPREYKLIIQRCINHGWITPIANVLERDISWEELIK